MQGRRSSVSTLPENISFDRGSASSDAGIDSQLSWNSIQTSSQSRLPGYRVSSCETNIPYLQHVRREGRSAEWSYGESSSSASQHQGGPSERKTEHVWAFHSGAALTLEEPQYEPSNILSLDNFNVNSSGNHTTGGSFLLQNSRSDTLPQDLNISSGFGDQVDDDCLVVERPTAYTSAGSSGEQMRSAGSSSAPSGGPSGCSGYVMDESDGRPGRSLDGRRTSCKRKALEGHTGQSSGVGSSNSFQYAERNQWHTIPAAQIASSNVTMPMATEDNIITGNGSQHTNPRLRLGVGVAVSANPFSLTTPSGNLESSRRNFRLRINGLHQQDPTADSPFSSEVSGNIDVSSSRRSSRSVPRNHMFDLNPAPVVENVNLHGQSIPLPVPSVRQNHSSGWSRASSTRAGNSSAPAISEERNSALHEEPTSRNTPRSISEHPVFIPSAGMGNASQNPMDWNLASGNNGIAENVASTSRAGPSTGASSSAPGWSHRRCPQYPRRLSEIVRRSLVSSAATDYGGRNNNLAAQSSSAGSREMALPSRPDNRRHRAPNSRSALLDRRLDSSFGIPYSLRTLAAASEGRSGIMSEIRHVLDLMRRGEGLRLEDVMILDQSVLFGMADFQDRHQDMRLDVDNMSYEELLALEERMGNVCTGLNEETIMSRLKQHKYVDSKPEDQVETEPCSVCREEYNNGEDLGTLECGHNFHADCIKQWLMHKNLCPICKTAGLTT